MKILVVEDNRKINNNICLYLKEKKCKTTQVFDGQSATEIVKDEHFDLIILDIMLPIMDGVSACKKIREAKVNTPILMLTALDQIHQKVSGLDAGADDYLVKPFSLEELYARIKALSRRQANYLSEKFEVGDLKLDASKREVKAKNKVVQLTIREFDLLHYLIKNSNRIVSKEEILEKVWGGGDSLMLSETVEVHISSIRKKVGKKHIETIRGAGYIIKSV